MVAAPPLSLVEQPAARAHQRRIAVVCVGLALLTAALLPVATRPFVVAPGVPAVFGTATAVADLLTFLLLVSQAERSTSNAIRIVACAYLYSGLMAFLHVLTFPGTVVPETPLLGGRDTVGWLFLAWRLGFALALLAGVLIGLREPLLPARTPLRMRYAAGVTALVTVLVLLVALGAVPMPRYFVGEGGNTFGGFVRFGTWTAAALCAVALFAIWRTRSTHKTLYLWLGLVLLATAAGLVMSETAGMRYTVGWYASRAYSLLASAVVLTLMLVEVVRLQRSLGAANDELGQRTQSLQAEMHRREAAERRLVQAQQLEVMGQLAGGVAHDFNNHLQVIGMRLELLRRRGSDRAALDADLEVLRRTLKRAEGLTRQLLSVSGRRAPRPRRIDLADWMPPYIELLRSLVRGDVKVELVVDPGVGSVEVDPGDLESALVNLVTNARDALGDHGRIGITLRNGIPADDANGEACVEIAVSDNGRGIAPDVLPRIFEPFFTTKEAGKGNGLGLSQVNAFVARSRGGVSIDSTPGRGTTVTLRLPRAAAPPATIERDVARPERLAPQAAGQSVLVVDDNEDVVASTGALLAQLGFVVHHASSGRQALDQLNAGARPRVVISDIVMPGPIDGLELARQVRRDFPEVGVILSTAYSRAADEAVAEGFAMLSKPYQPAQLEQEVLAALRALAEKPR